MKEGLLKTFDEILNEKIAPFLKKNGFKKQNLNFYKQEEDLKFMFNFQRNRYNSVNYVRFYINCGIYSEEFEQMVGEEIFRNPKEYECLFRVRIEQITKYTKSEFEVKEGDERSKIILSNLVIRELEKVINFYKTIHTIDELVDLCIKKDTFFHEKVLTYLSLKKDMSRLEKYFQICGNRYKDNNKGKQSFEDRINEILVENDIYPMKFNKESEEIGPLRLVNRFLKKITNRQ